MMAAAMTELAAILRDAGLAVREVPGWRDRGHGAMGEVLGVLCHHTAGAPLGLYPSERIVVDGRPGLAGPLAQLGLARDGTWIVIAAGQAWHAGTGSMPWVPAGRGNTHLIGVEAESVGTRDDWTPEQRASYPRGVAALLRHLDLPPSRAIGHKEWAPSRKIDPAFWDMNTFRADVARWLSDDLEDDMPTVNDLFNAPVQRAGGRTGTTTLAATLAWLDANLQGVYDRVDAVAAKVDDLHNSTAGGPPVLTAADHAAIAEQVADLLAARLGRD